MEAMCKIYSHRVDIGELIYCDMGSDHPWPADKMLEMTSYRAAQVELYAIKARAQIQRKCARLILTRQLIPTFIKRFLQVPILLKDNYLIELPAYSTRSDQQLVWVSIWEITGRLRLCLQLHDHGLNGFFRHRKFVSCSKLSEDSKCCYESRVTM